MKTKNREKYYYIFYALIIALSTFSGIFNLGTILYIVSVVVFIVVSILFKSNRLTFGLKAIVVFLFVCLFSIIINEIPSYFRVWERLMVFFCVLLAFSPLIVSKNLNKNRILLFDGLIMTMILFGAASFVGYFFGINYFVRNGEILDLTGAGHFSGFTNHSMALAPISAMGSIWGLTKALSLRGKNKQRLVWWTVTLMCLGSVLLSASRGALVGVILAIIVAVYRYSSSHISVFLRYVMFAIAGLAITFPLWEGLTHSVIEKNNYNISEGGVAYSRETKMSARIYEIKNNFLTGVGFSVVDEAVDSVDHSTGTIEPNSSWLGVFSMTGIFGFILFLDIFLQSFYLAFKKISNKKDSAMLSGILGFFFVHMMIEGYVLAAGSFLCGTYWLTLGVIFAKSRSPRVLKFVPDMVNT